MAKQSTIGSGVVAAGRAVSAAKGGFLGDQFMAGYDKSLETKKEKEAENKETQARVNNLMGQFKNDIDVLKFKPEDQTLVKNTITQWRNGYADAANAASKIQDKSSAAYQEQVDIMNDYKNRMVNLKGNLDNLAAFKGEYAKNIDAGHYSNAGANSMSLAQGETMVTNPIGSINDSGDLVWGPGTGSVREGFSFKDYQMPFEKALDAPVAWAKIAEPYTKRKTPANDIDDANIRTGIEKMLENNQVFASLVSDSDMPQLRTQDIDPEDPNARKIVTDRLVQAVYDQWGAATEYEPGKDTRTAAQKNAVENKNRISNYFNKNVPYFEVDDYGFENKGDHWIILDKDGLPVLTASGAERKARTKQDVYAILGL